MILELPVLVRRDLAGHWSVATLGPPGLSADGPRLEEMLARLARGVRRAALAVPKGSLRSWLARSDGRLERPDLKVEVRVSGKKEWVHARFARVAWPAPGALEGSLVAVPSVEGFVLHVRPGQDEATLLARALARWFEDDRDALAAAAIGRSASLQTLEVDLEGESLVDRRREGEQGPPGLLAGGPRGRRSRRTREELLQAETLFEVGRDLAGEAREGRLAATWGLEREVEDAWSALVDGDVRAVLLVGAPGTGKSALVHELARRSAARQDERRWRRPRGGIFTVSAPRLVAGMRYVGQWEERTLALADEAAALDCVLHSDSLPELLAAGRTGQGGRTNAASLLRPRIASGALALVAECTPEGLRRCEEEDRALVELCRVIRLAEPSPRAALEVALRAARALESRVPVAFAPRAVKTSLDLLGRFVPYEAFPGKAVRFLERLAERARSSERPAVGPEEALAGFAEGFGLARELLSDAALLEPEAVRRGLAERVRGQPEALAALVDVVCTLKAGLQDREKPVASLLFVGPTGTGKTECAKALASVLFGSEERLVRFDLNEASDPTAVARLVGGPGWPEGELVRAIRDRPFSVVLLDEVEKAHPAVHDVLLQLLGEGRLTDALGRTADARSCVFVLTSNLGAEDAGRALGFEAGADEERHEAEARRFQRAVEGFFRPELVNRFDRIVAFRPLEGPVLREIAAREVAALLGREGLARRRVLLDADDALLDLLVREGASSKYGARPLRRAIERRLTAPLARELARIPGAGTLHVALRLAPGEPEVAIVLAPLEGLGEREPAPPRDDAEARGEDAAAAARALAERLAALERSPARRAVEAALLEAARAEAGASALDAGGVARLHALELELKEARDEVDRLLGPLDDEGWVERVEAEDHGEGARPGTRVRIEAAGVPPPDARAVRTLARRLARLEALVATATGAPERVVLELVALGASSRPALAEVLLPLYWELFARLGLSARVREAGDAATLEAVAAALGPRPGAVSLVLEFPQARRWLVGEAGLHEIVRDGKAAVVSARVVGGDGEGRGEVGGPRRAVRRYVVGSHVHDARLGRSFTARARGETDLASPLEDAVLAGVLHSGAQRDIPLSAGRDVPDQADSR